MRRRSLLVLAAAAAALTLSGGAPSAATSVPTTGALRICSNCAEHGLGGGSRYRYVILQPWEYGRIPQLKSANPAVRVLAYKNMAASYSYSCRNGVDDPLTPGGVGYCWASASHPEWFLSDTAGQRIQFCDYPGLWQMDVGSAAYQSRWAQNVASELEAKGFDGVVIDDANQNEKYHLCGKTIAKYPSGSDYTVATERFLAAVGPALRGQGFLVLANIWLEDWWNSTGTALWDRWVSYGSGAVQEHFTKWGSDASRWLTDDGRWHDDWSNQLQYETRTQAAGKIFIGITYAPANDSRSMRYARASFLAEWNGGPSALVFEPTDPEQQDPYAAAWTVDVGTPLGPRYRVGTAWRRDFTDGAVVVNPSTSPQTVDLRGTFALPDGTAVTSVTLASADAVLLRSASQPDTAPPPGPPAKPPRKTRTEAV